MHRHNRSLSRHTLALREVQHLSRFTLLFLLAGESRRWEGITGRLRGLLSSASPLVLVCTREQNPRRWKPAPIPPGCGLQNSGSPRPQSLRGCVPSLKGAEQLNPPQTKTEGRGTKPTSWPALVEDAQMPTDPAKTNTWVFKAVSESFGHPALCSRAHLKLFNLSPPPAWMPLTPCSPVPCSQR